MFEESYRNNRRKRVLLDLLPLIDVIFILLIFFMVSTTFTKLGVNITRPKAKNIEKIQQFDLNIYISKDGKFYYEKDELSNLDLSGLIKAKLGTNPSMVVVFNPDKEATTQRLLDALDICKDSGAINFSIASKKRYD